MRFGDYNERGLAWAATLANSHNRPGSEILHIAEGLYRKNMPHHPWSIALNEEAVMVSLTKNFRSVFETSAIDEAVAIVNGILMYSQARPVISRHDEENWHLHFADANAPNSAMIGSTAATALAVLICDSGLERIGICSQIDCDRAYTDLSRNNRKKYCSSRCSTRASVAAHRERVRDTAAGEGKEGDVLG